ncbi:trypsin-like peptidase domain-containing protein [Candidatus Agathobaculum pullicola]|uniref:trypsin-like peptidase domain-containing protein n=1 Tax=Candidatus Agathobaculum pullicola TaxID=2838426 RepID=UPI003F93446C
MKKRICSLLVAAALMLGLLPSAFAGYENFAAQAMYTPGQFTDVADNAWYADNVRAAYEYGLINGQSATRFAPDSSLTVAEAVKLAASLHSIYNTGSAEFASSSPWYRTYVDYALQNGILQAERSDYTQPASRAVFASVLAAALPTDALGAINTIADGAIPDVSTSASYAEAVYLLYRAGVLTGSDSAGRFMPTGTIKRSEAAAIVTRMADSSLRRTFSLEVSTELTASEIFARCMPAVFKLYSYDTRGNVLSMGSGVIISANGDAVTCGHIANGVQRLVAEMQDGTKREVAIYDIDTTADISHIRVVGSGLPYLETSNDVQTGDTVYALGYPGGGSAKVTAGVVTNPKNGDYLTTLIESTASVISGNSGGALVDGQGRLVGVTVSSRGSGTPSYSVPISVLETLEGSAAVSPAVYTSTHQPDASNCYAKLYPVPDFSIITGVPLLDSVKDRGTTYFYYRLSDLNGDGTRQMLQYYAALNGNTFYQFSDGAFTSSAGYLMSVKIIETYSRGEQALGICVSGISSQPIGGLVQAADLSFAGICASCGFS